MSNIRTEFEQYRTLFEKELRNGILPFWIKFAPDNINGGFVGAADLDGNPVGEENKSCVLNARILWTFSTAAIHYNEPASADMAHRAWQTLQNNFADREYGGYYMEITPDNRIASGIKHTYAQAFVIYALCRYYEFTGSPDVLDTVKSFFMMLEEKSRDKTNPGYLESFTREWVPYAENRMADNNEPRSMNTHLHLLEAWSAVYRVWKDELVRDRLRELITLFLDRIIRPDGHLGIFFDESFTEVEASRGICSFGHDIEASWLLWEASLSLGEEDIIRRMKPVSLLMASSVERTGFDRDGGLFLESSRYGSHLRTNKHWWLQAETLVGFMNAFELSGDQRYWNNVKLSWDFIDRYVIDHERGEWYTKVNRLGVPFTVEPHGDPSPYYRNDRKIDPWKCPYHNGRAMMELIERIDLFLKKA